MYVGFFPSSLQKHNTASFPDIMPIASRKEATHNCGVLMYTLPYAKGTPCTYTLLYMRTYISPNGLFFLLLFFSSLLSFDCFGLLNVYFLLLLYSFAGRRGRGPIPVHGQERAGRGQPGHEPRGRYGHRCRYV